MLTVSIESYCCTWSHSVARTHTHIHTHIHTHTQTLVRTPQGKRSARLREFYMKIHCIHKRHIRAQAGLEPAIPSKRSATDPLLRPLCHLPSQCHFAHHRSHTGWSGIEPGPLRWGDGDANRLSHDTALNCCLQTIKLKIHQHFPPKYLVHFIMLFTLPLFSGKVIYEGWNFNSGNYLFTTDIK